MRADIYIHTSGNAKSRQAAKSFIENGNVLIDGKKVSSDIKKEIYNYYIENPNELIIWLYENQGEMRFDAANRFYVVLIDRDNPFESWKLKRNVSLLKTGINDKIAAFDSGKLNKIKFNWFKDGKFYECFSELLFICK